jgi:ectoine hydroxylase-related dioxygenase (phytanoyl-CoA dioxygenase family)
MDLPHEAALDAPFALTDEHHERFRRTGHVTVRGALPAEVIAQYAPVLERLVEPRRAKQKPMAERSTYEQAFVQVFNLWRRDEAAKAFVFSRRLARMAAELIDATGVRLYHDQALFKELGGGKTPWHADQYYWPLASDKTITAWVPLQDIPMEMGPLAFADGSHTVELGRDLAISDESEAAMAGALADFPMDEAPYAVGDVSFHSGWVFHRAGPNLTGRMRGAMTMIYMDEAMRMAAPKSKAQEIDGQIWLPGATVGEVIDTPLNPVIWSSR